MRLRSFIGLFVMLGLAVLLSFKKRDILKSKRVIIGGLLIQLTFAFFVMKVPFGAVFFKKVGDGVSVLLNFTHEGSKFVFGDLFKSFSFAVHVLPTIIFFSSFMGILYYLGVMQFIVKILAKGMAKLLGTSGAESLSATANIFVGQTEAPLVIKPYIDRMTNSEITAVMVGGFATVAGGVLAAYIGMGVDAGSLIAASVMAAPGSLVIAKILYPETEHSVTMGKVEFDEKSESANVIDAAARGASDGLSLALNVGAMLIAFVAIIYGLNYGIKEISSLFLETPLSLEKIFGWIFSPIAWIIGVEWKDTLLVGQLLGEKMVINEFYAFSDLSQNIAQHISPRSNIMTAFALTGFANFASIAIQIGGIGSIAPSRKGDLARIGLRAMLGGTIVALINAAIAGFMM
ncbi:NupC/NupG family nucleoside CNT transporter [bacterium]|nr:NupC/NupG family nucleoside CNT transporter [bacterium]